MRQSFTQPEGADPFAVIDAHLEASFEAVLARESGAPQADAAPRHHRAGGPVSDPTVSSMNTNLPWIHGTSSAWPASVGPVGGAAPTAWLGRPQSMPLPNADLERLITEASARHHVPDWLVRNVIRAESGGNPGATSPVGAMGLRQLMPGTAEGLGVTDAYDAAQNVDGGPRYLGQLLDHFGGDYSKAVAAYNAGPGAVDRYAGVPPFAETQAYVRRVLQ